MVSQVAAPTVESRTQRGGGGGRSQPEARERETSARVRQAQSGGEGSVSPLMEGPGQGHTSHRILWARGFAKPPGGLCETSRASKHRKHEPHENRDSEFSWEITKWLQEKIVSFTWLTLIAPGCSEPPDSLTTINQSPDFFIKGNSPWSSKSSSFRRKCIPPL